LVFSFLTTLSVSTLISSVINANFPDKRLFFLTIFLAGISSLFHTGKVTRIWRSIYNMKSSPLSREIGCFIIYSSLSIFAVFSELPFLLAASSVIGLILLLLIDSVYIYADRRRSVIIHSGQTFLSSLLIISFFTGSVIPFIFIALIKIVTSSFKLTANNKTGTGFGIRFLRLALLIITGIRLITGSTYPDMVIVSFFVIGEFLDRVIFYIDFNPLNINTLIQNHLIFEKNEKKRG
jgi:DMSO reductase anchor subunit